MDLVCLNIHAYLSLISGLTNLEELALDRTSVTDEGACVIQGENLDILLRPREAIA